MKKNKDKTADYSPETFLIHGLPYDAHWEYGHHVVPPITASTAFRLDSTQRGQDGFASFLDPQGIGADGRPIYVYDRLGEPTVALLENSFREIEKGASATGFASGMAAISGAFLAACRMGQEILVHQMVYGCTYSLLTNWLPRLGIRSRFIDFRDLDAVRAAIGEQTRMLFFETPANPTLELIDIEGVAAVAAEANAGRSEGDWLYVAVDNTFATPYCQRPLELGADMVVHSLTKNVMGFGTDMGGMVVAPEQLHGNVRLVRKDFGGVVAPRAAWNILVYGMTSLPVRTRAQTDNARLVAQYLANRPEVEAVSYPGLKSHPQHDLAVRQMKDFKGRFAPGIMVYFELAGEEAVVPQRVRHFMDHVATHAYSLTLAVSLGQAKTLVEAPALMTHCVYGADAEQARMSLAGIRISLGIEDPEDIIRDLEQAFEAID